MSGLESQARALAPTVGSSGLVPFMTPGAPLRSHPCHSAIGQSYLSGGCEWTNSRA